MFVDDSSYPPAVPWNPDTAFRPKLITTDGAEQATAWLDAPATDSAASARWVVSADFSRYDRTARTIYLPDGTRGYYDGFGRLFKMLDSFGNVVTLDWQTGDYDFAAGTLVVKQALTDTETRTVSFTMNNKLPLTMRYSEKTWTYEYEYQGSLARFMKSVQPPMGPAWIFDHNDRGELDFVQTPYGGVIRYTYGDHQFGIDQIGRDPSIGPLISRVIHDRTVKGRAIQEGTWMYTYADLPYGSQTTIETPSGDHIIYTHESTGSPTVVMIDSEWGVKTRSVRDAASGQELEKETRSYVRLPVGSSTTTAELAQVDITRAGRAYSTVYKYSTNDAVHFADFHRPVEIRETGDRSRVTSRAYDYEFNLSKNGLPYFFGKLKTETIAVDAKEFKRFWTYNHDNGFTQAETMYGIATSFEPDDYGNVTKMTKANATAASYTYSWGVMKDTITKAHTVTREINPDGTVASETRGGRKTTFTYDDLFRIHVTQPPPGSYSITAYYDDPTPGTVRVKRGDSVSTTTLDGFGRPIETVNGAGIHATTAYHAEGRKIYEGYPFEPNGANGGTLNRGTKITYDGLGRVKKRENPDTTAVNLSYDLPGKVTITDENGYQTVQTYEAFGNPDETRLIGVKDAADQQWTYTYDGLGQLTGVTAPDGLARTWTYDTQRPTLLSSETHPESGKTEYTDYDAAGNLKGKKDANGVQFTYEYDGNDRLSKITAGYLVTTITYEAGTDNRESASVGAASSTFKYDDAGRLKQRDDLLTTAAFTTKFEYDGYDNLSQLTYPSGRQVHYDYDLANRITQVRDIGAAKNYATNVKYHPSGAIASYLAGNQITHSTTFHDTRYWVTGVAGGELQLTYTNYDNVGNVRKIADNRPGFTQDFTYDTLDRLETATGLAAIRYVYDAHGNRSDPNNVINSTTLRLDVHNGMSLTYDGNGNLKSAGTATYTYTPHNMLASALAGGTTTAYAYDADQWRVMKTGAGATTFYIRGPHGELLSEWQAPAGDWMVRDYVYLGSRLIAAVSK